MRIKGGNKHNRRNKILKIAKGYRGSKSTLYRAANQQVMKSGNYAFAGRRMRKRDFRQLWIARINAAARMNGLSYSRMMDGLKKGGVDINRKMLADIAVKNPADFAVLAEKAKKALA